MRDNIRWTKDKYLKKLEQAKMMNILEHLITPFLIEKIKYYEYYFDWVINEKREEYKTKLRKKLKTQREILAPF